MGIVQKKIFHSLLFCLHNKINFQHQKRLNIFTKNQIIFFMALRGGHVVIQIPTIHCTEVDQSRYCDDGLLLYAASVLWVLASFLEMERARSRDSHAAGSYLGALARARRSPSPAPDTLSSLLCSALWLYLYNSSNMYVHYNTMCAQLVLVVAKNTTIVSFYSSGFFVVTSHLVKHQPCTNKRNSV